MDELDNGIDLTRPSLQSIADTGHAFAVPWTHTVRPILGGFESSRIMSKAEPWVDVSPFDEAAVRKCTMVYESNGESFTYRDAFSSQSQSNSDHMSVSGSISVGPPFLQAEGSGEYDKTVLENSNVLALSPLNVLYLFRTLTLMHMHLPQGIQSSRIASFKVGRVVLDDFPSYSPSAIKLLSQPGGAAQFRKCYGDFFIRGFTLGADAGICLAAHAHSKDTKEQLKVKLTVKVLFWSASIEHEETTENHEGSADLKVCGYSTMAGEAEKLETESTSYWDQQRVRDVATKYMRVISGLEKDVRASLRELRLKEGARVPLSEAFGLCRSGIVVQLLLFPHARTEQYLRVRKS